MQSPEIKNIAAALMEVQSTLSAAKKDAHNPHFKKNYADINSVWEAVRNPLISNGLAVAQLPGKDDQGHYVETLLMHTSGEWISSKTYTIPEKQNPQGVGSAITYARRYGLSSMVGVCTEEDDDAEGSMGRQQPAQNQQQPQTKKQPKETDDL